jgi:hypothetical protein
MALTPHTGGSPIFLSMGTRPQYHNKQKDKRKDFLKRKESPCSLGHVYLPLGIFTRSQKKKERTEL